MRRAAVIAATLRGVRHQPRHQRSGPARKGEGSTMTHHRAPARRVDQAGPPLSSSNGKDPEG